MNSWLWVTLNLLYQNHIIIQQRTKFDTELKSLKFLLEIMMLVSLANSIGSGAEFIFKGVLLYMYYEQ